MADVLRAADAIRRASVAPLGGDRRVLPFSEAARAAELALAGDDQVRAELALADIGVAAVYELAAIRKGSA